MSSQFKGHPLFDTQRLLKAQAESLDDYPTLSEFLSGHPHWMEDWKAAVDFLDKHVTSAETYSKFRGEIQRAMLFFWLIQDKGLREVNGDDIDAYFKFLKKRPASWMTGSGGESDSKKGTGRQRAFINSNGVRMPNPNWRPLLGNHTRMTAATLDLVTRVLGIFFKRMTITGYMPRSPMIDATRRSQQASRSENSGNKKGIKSPAKPRRKAPRLTGLQWSALHDALVELADEDSRYERNLFLVVTMKTLYLRVFELSYHHGDLEGEDGVEPVMGHFGKTPFGDEVYWELYVSGKGEKDRWIPLPTAYLPYLERYRTYRGLTPLPSANDMSPIIAQLKSEEPVTSKRTLESVVEESFLLAADRLAKRGKVQLAEELKQASTKTHILRHTGASMDIEAGRPIRDVSEDLGHGSAAFTEEIYIDADTERRYASGAARSVV